MFCQAGSVENEPIRIRIGGGEDSKTGDSLLQFFYDTDAFYSRRYRAKSEEVTSGFLSSCL